MQILRDNQKRHEIKFMINEKISSADPWGRISTVFPPKSLSKAWPGINNLGRPKDEVCVNCRSPERIPQ